MSDPVLNADGLPAIPLTNEEKFGFDAKGWVAVPAVRVNPGDQVHPGNACVAKAATA